MRMNMKTIYSSKKVNPNYYMELGVDDNQPVLYVYKEGDLFDWHFSMGSSYMSEMQNTIGCYQIIHDIEPRIEDIMLWRNWFKELKNKRIIS